MSLADKMRAASKVEVSDNDLMRLSNYITALTLEEAEVANLELRLAEKKAYVLKMVNETIPAQMDALGMEEFTTKDGVNVKIKPFYGGHIKEENKVEAFTWLRDNGQGSIIKTEIKLNFGMGEEEMATDVKLTLTARNIPFSDKESVHPSTFISFIKEKFESGMDLPPIFGAFAGKAAKIKTKTKKD